MRFLHKIKARKEGIEMNIYDFNNVLLILLGFMLGVAVEYILINNLKVMHVNWVWPILLAVSLALLLQSIFYSLERGRR